MKAICYIQIVPRYWSNGTLRGIQAKQLSQRHPGSAMDGARLVRLEIEVPDAAFKATQVSVSIPAEKVAGPVTATVS